MNLLEEVIELSIEALRAEDNHIRSTVRSRGENGGLVRVYNERYCQFFIWRAVLSRWPVLMEKEYRDLIITDDNGQRHIFEMKWWRHESTNELQPDIIKLGMIANGGYFIVFSANPKNLTDENIACVGKLEGLGLPCFHRRFDTLSERGDDYHFWIAGWPVPPVPVNAPASVGDA